MHAARPFARQLAVAGGVLGSFAPTASLARRRAAVSGDPVVRRAARPDAAVQR